MDKNKKLLREVVNAWESLEGGHDYRIFEIENWLINNMKPVLDKIRIHLGLPTEGK